MSILKRRETTDNIINIHKYMNYNHKQTSRQIDRQTDSQKHTHVQSCYYSIHAVIKTAALCKGNNDCISFYVILFTRN